MRKRTLFIITIGMILYLGIRFVSHADTVILNSKERIKGVIVEDYKDRIIISTVEGEKKIMREDIKDIIYDLEEQNLTSLGDLYQDKGSYKKAYYYYDKALEINPDYKKAKDGLNYVGTYLQQTSRRLKLDQLERRNVEDEWRKRGAGVSEPSKEEEIKNTFGFGLREEKGRFEIYEIRPGSAADKAGLRKGDILLEAWGRAVSYMQPEEVMNKLMTPSIMDMQITIERTRLLNIDNNKGKYNVLLGGRLGFSEIEGLMFKEVYPGKIADKAGLKEGDIVISLGGKSTRYMSMKDAADIIAMKKGDTLSLKIKRNIILWKKFKVRQ